MMQRKCPNCGWIHPSSFSPNKCKKCKTPLHPSRCMTCKKLFNEPLNVRGDCKKCNMDRVLKWRAENKDKERAKFLRCVKKKETKYLNKILPFAEQPFVRLTEEEWLDTCSYFGGCAMCPETHIETRRLVLQPKHGGAYTPWNVIPCCGTCSQYYISANPYKDTHEAMPKILDYLEGKLKKYDKQS